MKEYYMFNKPRDCITACSDERHKTVMDYFPQEKREILFPVGRLDKDTAGFLLITNDGLLGYDLMKPENKVPKTYFFWAQGTLSEEKIAELEAGVSIYKNKDTETAPAKIIVEDVSVLRDIKELLLGKNVNVSNRRGDTPVVSGYITITEGKKHQVKRMLGFAGCRVVYLKRVKIGDLLLDDSLAEGEYRSISAEEIRLMCGSVMHRISSDMP